MTRESKAAFRMAGYTYPGTSPATKKIKREDFDVDNLAEEEEEVIDNEEVKASLLGGIAGSVRNIGAKRRMTKRTK